MAVAWDRIKQLRGFFLWLQSIVFEEPIVSDKNVIAFYEHQKKVLLFSEDSTTGIYPELDWFNQHLHTTFL
jgi:hypothetical protein